MAGHLFISDRIPSSVRSKSQLPITEDQYKAGAKGIKKDDLLFLGFRKKNEDNQIALWLVANAKAGVAKAANGKYSVGLKFIKLKTTKSSYTLCDGIATGEQLRRVGWKPLDNEEVAACFVDTKVYEQQSKKFRKVIEAAIPTPKGFQIKLNDVHKSVLWNASVSGSGPVLRKWYDSQIVLSEDRYRDALENRLSELNGYEFEALIEAFFQMKALGFTLVKATKKARDGGIDVEIVCQGDVFGKMQMVAHCKCRTAVVVEKEIREFWGIVNDREAGRGIFITTSHFSPDAIKYYK
jgi:hypothetical protein